MNLEWSAITLASHVTLVLAIAFGFANAIAVRRHWIAKSPVVLFRRLEWPVFAISAAMITERLYYVFARLNVNTDLNLWRAHPAPEFLAMWSMCSFLWLAVSIRRLDGAAGMRVRRVIRYQIAAILTVFSLFAWGLW